MDTPELRVYCKLEKELRMMIGSGFMPDFHRLRSETWLAAKYGISRGSVRRALDHLENDGLLTRRRGSGTYVAPQSVRKEGREWHLGGKTILYLSFSSLYSRQTFTELTTFHNVYDGFMEILPKNGYGFRCAHVGTDWKVPPELSDPGVAGVIFEGVVPLDFFRRCLADKPSVGVNCFDPELPCSWVLEDSRGIAEAEVGYLYRMGYRRIAILSDECSTPPIREAFLGYCTGLRQAGLPFREDFVIFWDRRRVNGELCSETLDRPSFKPHLAEIFSREDHPDAVICQDPYRAECTREALASWGLRVPDDIGILCRTSPRRSRKRRSALEYSGFYARKVEVLAEAARQLIDEIENRAPIKRRVTYLAPEFVPGMSVRNMQADPEHRKSEVKP